MKTEEIQWKSIKLEVGSLKNTNKWNTDKINQEKFGGNYK